MLIFILKSSGKIPMKILYITRKAVQEYLVLLLVISLNTWIKLREV